MNLFIAGNDGTAHIFENTLCVKLSVKVLLTNFPRPSTAFKNIFPVNPSVTIAWISPEKASLPYTLPTKLIPNSSEFSFNNL